MTPQLIRTRKLLLVEDNSGDAELVAHMLENPDGEVYEISRATHLAEAIEGLRAAGVDVVLLDLDLPDSSGAKSVEALRLAAGAVPIVVLTGTDDESVANAAMKAGAHDYLTKEEFTSRNLRRVIGYAIARMRELQLNQLQESLDGYRSLSSSAQGTLVTAALAGSGAVSLRKPETFEALVRDYLVLLQPYLARLSDRIEPKRSEMEKIVTTLGDVSGGPRDLIDMHVAALDRAVAQDDTLHSRSLVYEARLLALEMMGLLVDYYRVGHRRRFL